MEGAVSFTEKVAQKFNYSTAKPGKATWPTLQRELKNVGFHFDPSKTTKTIPEEHSVFMDIMLQGN